MTEYGPYDKLPPFYENTIVELDIPSGKIIAADSLRYNDYFDVEPELSINYGRGTDRWAHQYAEHGVGYAFVGNSCPSIVRKPGDVLEVVNFAWETDEDGDLLDQKKEDEDIVAYICTDLWATMITDYQNWLDNGGPAIEREQDKNHKTYSLITVTPGRYRWIVFSHNDSFNRWDAPDRIVYAELELIQPYLPVANADTE